MNQLRPTIQVASDHAGFECKEGVKRWLRDHGYEVIDHGAKTYDPLDNYPDFISKAAAAVAAAPAVTKALIFGASGQGEAMLANRYPNVRATVYYAPSTDIVKLSREHNDANVLSIGARFVKVDEVIEILPLWLETEVSPLGKYHERIRQVEQLTKKIRNL